MEQYLMTKTTRKRLKKELVRLRKELEDVQMQMGDAANNYPDLRENFAYMDRYNETYNVAAKIEHVKEKIGFSKIIKFKKKNKKVCIGSKVKVLFISNSEEMIIRILGEEDAKTKPGKWISYKSVLGKALLDSKEADILVVNGNKVKVLEIL